MAASKDLCIIANMGTLGDFKPAFLAAVCFAREGNGVVVLAQPKDEPFVVQTMSTVVGFTQNEGARLKLEGECQKHTFYPPVGGPPKVVSGEEFHVLLYHFQKLAFEPKEGGRAHVRDVAPPILLIKRLRTPEFPCRHGTDIGIQ